MSRQMTPHTLQALREWNQRQPAWNPIKHYEQLTPAQQSEVDDRADDLEFAAMMTATADSVRRMIC